MEWYVAFSLKWLTLHVLLIILGLLTVYEVKNNAIMVISTLESNVQTDWRRINNFGAQMTAFPELFESALETQINTISNRTVSGIEKTMKFGFDLSKNIFVFLLKILTGTIKCLLDLLLDVGYDLTTSVLVIIQDQLDAIINSVQTIITGMESDVNNLKNSANTDFQAIKDVIQSVIGDISFLNSFQLLDNYAFPSISFSAANQLTSNFDNLILNPFINSKPDLNSYWDTAEDSAEVIFDTFIDQFDITNFSTNAFVFTKNNFTLTPIQVPFLKSNLYNQLIFDAFQGLFYIGFSALIIVILINLTTTGYELYSASKKIKVISIVLKRDKSAIPSLKNQGGKNSFSAISIYQYFKSPVLFKLSRSISYQKSNSIFKYLNIMTYPFLHFFFLSILCLSLMYNCENIAKDLHKLEPILLQDLIGLTENLETEFVAPLVTIFEARFEQLNQESRIFLSEVEQEINSKISEPIEAFGYLIGNTTSTEVQKIYGAINFLADEIQWPEFSVAIKGLLDCALVNKVEKVERVVLLLANALEVDLRIPDYQFSNSTLEKSIWSMVNGQKQELDLNCTTICVEYKPQQQLDSLIYSILTTQHEFFQSLYSTNNFCPPFDTFAAQCNNKALSSEYTRFLSLLQQKINAAHVVFALSYSPWFVLWCVLFLKVFTLLGLKVLKFLFATLIFIVKSLTNSSFFKYKIALIIIKARPFKNRFTSHISSAMDTHQLKEKYIEFKNATWNYVDGIKIRILTYLNKL